MPDNRLDKSRLGRAGRLGGMAAAAAARQLGTRAANTMRSDEEAEEALGRQALETADRIVKVLGGMKGAAMKVGQTLSVLDPGMVPGPYRDEFQAKLAQLQAMAPTVSFKEMRKVIEQDLGEPLTAAFEGVRPGGGGGRLDRPGLPRDPPRRPAGGRQGPVPGDQGRRPRRPQEPRHAPAARRPVRPGARHQGDRPGDHRAHHRGARLRARGDEPPGPGPRVPQPPVHRRPAGDHRALPRARDRHRVHRGAELRRHPHRRGRGKIPRGARSCSASTSTARTATCC